MSNLEEDIKLILDDFYKKNYNSALKSLLPIIKKNPEYLFGLKILGSIYLQMGRLFDAHRVNKKVTELSPKDPEGHYNLAINLKAMNNITGSIKAYNNAIILKSNYVEAYNNLGLIFLEIEKFKEAKSYFIKTLSLLSGSSIKSKRFSTFQNPTERFELAISLLHLKENKIKINRKIFFITLKESSFYYKYYFQFLLNKYIIHHPQNHFHYFLRSK